LSVSLTASILKAMVDTGDQNLVTLDAVPGDIGAASKFDHQFPIARKMRWSSSFRQLA
jgi:hypothetical protein